ncbi:MAG: 16S rRNA (cytidine(1402)-2'-O)-methyltransferase [Pseudomonadota bacterium]
MNNGTLYIIATPIGNLEDMTLRALRVLKEVDLIAAEDTRKTRNLLTHFDIQTPTTSFFKGNENEKFFSLIEKMKAGQNIALVSNAGTPCISDPGFPLVKRAIEEGITVVPIPGVSAVIAALSAAGLPTDRFTFFGFLPEKRGKRGRVLEIIKGLDHTAVLYMSPWKVLHQLNEMAELFPDREATLCHELTKIHEGFIRGTISTLCTHLDQHPPKGEYVLIISS